MRQGEIWIVDLEPTLGHGQRGKRPVLVVSPDSVHTHLLPIVCSITRGGVLPRLTGLAVSLAASGTRTSGVVLCHQIRALDIQARRGRRIETVPEPILNEVLAKLTALFE